MSETYPVIAERLAAATAAVFGDSELTEAVKTACNRYAQDVANVAAGRGIPALLIAVVGSKGQGKTWVARQFVRDTRIRELLRSGDLQDDATTGLVWIGPVAPDGLDPDVETYHPCQTTQLAQIGQPYVILDTPGLTDTDHRAAKLAQQALSLAPVKLLVIARDQIRAAANLMIAHQIDGAICVPILTSVEPEEEDDGASAASLEADIRSLRDQLQVMAPRCTLAETILVPDFEISGDEDAAGQSFLSSLLDRFNELGLTHLQLGSTREHRIKAATERLRAQVRKLIGDELPHLASAVDRLQLETEHLPQRVLDSLLGSEQVLQTGVRMRLRARLVADTSLLSFPYRTMLSLLNLTQGAWDRVLLALSGSVPSLFGALATWTSNAKQSRDFAAEIEGGIRARTQQQVQERLTPLCEQFHRAVMRLRPRSERVDHGTHTAAMTLSGIEELQTRSQQIFDSAIERSATRNWQVQLLAFIGVALFWSLMAGPIVLIYREYFVASYHVLSGRESRLEEFPHPTPALLLTSLLLSILPLALYCMVVLTISLSRRKVVRVTQAIVSEHQEAIAQLQEAGIIRLEFEDRLLQQAQYLLNLRES